MQENKIESGSEAREQSKELEQKKERIAVFGNPEDPLEQPVLPNIEKPKYRPDQIEIIMTRISELPFEIKANESKVFALTQKEDYINKRSNEIKERLYLNISTEKSVGAQKYPDLQAQEKEALKRLQASKLWEKKNAEIYGIVGGEEESEGKKKFPNEKARQAETVKRVYQDTEIKELNQRLLNHIKEEKEEDRLAFPNEKSREIEVNRRLNEHPEHKTLMSELNKTISDLHKTKADIYCLRGEMKSVEIITELMKLKLRVI
jgi:site-specific DNA-cytosine methylase